MASGCASASTMMRLSRPRIERLRGKLDWSMVAFGLLEREFTLFEFQRVHEIILGRPVNKPHFRKKMLGMAFADGRRLVATGRYSRAGAASPGRALSAWGRGGRRVMSRSRTGPARAPATRIRSRSPRSGLPTGGRPDRCDLLPRQGPGQCVHRCLGA